MYMISDRLVSNSRALFWALAIDPNLIRKKIVGEREFWLNVPIKTLNPVTNASEIE